jgi:hypothetical protein
VGVAVLAVALIGVMQRHEQHRRTIDIHAALKDGDSRLPRVRLRMGYCFADHSLSKLGSYTVSTVV